MVSAIRMWRHYSILLPAALVLSGCVHHPATKLEPKQAVPQVSPAQTETNGHAQRMFVSTMAGSPYYYGNNDGTNTDARLSYPWGVAVDRAGNVYVADFANLIRKVTPVGSDWVVSTIAGGRGGWADGTGEQARFDCPSAIAVDQAGNLYVTEMQSWWIRKLSPTPAGWVVTTVGKQPESGADDWRTNQQMWVRNAHGVAVDDAGNLFVADSGENTIRKFSPNGAGWLATTIAGQTRRSGHADGRGENALFDSPYGIALDRAGNIYVTDYENFTVRRLRRDGADWVVDTIAGQAKYAGSSDGTNSQARFYRPSGIAIDRTGALFVADSGNHTVRKLTPNGNDWAVSTIAGSPREHGRSDSTAVWSISRVGTNWTASMLTGGSGNIASTNDIARFFQPEGVAVDSAGRLYVADLDNHAIRLCRSDLPWPPPLRASFTTNHMVLSWPITTSGFALETATRLIPKADWITVTNTVVVSDQTLVLTNDLPSRTVFYRFRHDTSQR
jgi:Uncharacterized conserved protein